MKRRYFNRVQLNGQAKLNFDTGMGTHTTTVPKVNREGKNNADSLIDTILHFAIMRLGSDRLLEVVNEKIAEYNGEYTKQGLYPDDQAAEDCERKPIDQQARGL